MRTSHISVPSVRSAWLSRCIHEVYSSHVNLQGFLSRRTVATEDEAVVSDGQAVSGALRILIGFLTSRPRGSSTEAAASQRCAGHPTRACAPSSRCMDRRPKGYLVQHCTSQHRTAAGSYSTACLPGGVGYGAEAAARDETDIAVKVRSEGIVTYA